MSGAWLSLQRGARRFRPLVQKLVRPVPWLLSNKPAASIAIGASLLLGGFQVSEALMRRELARAEAEAKRDLTKVEHAWADQREQRARRETYLQALITAKSNSDRKFVVESLSAGATGEDRKWLEQVRGFIDLLSEKDAAKLEAGQTANQEAERATSLLTLERDAEKDQGKRRALDERVRQQAHSVAARESTLEPVRERVVGSPSSYKRYLCEVRGVAYPIKLNAGLVEDECRRIAQAACSNAGANLCQWNVAAL